MLQQLSNTTILRNGGGPPRNFPVSTATQKTIDGWLHPTPVTRRTTVFCAVFDFHSFYLRKNILGIINAFKQAFISNSYIDQDVMLIVKSSWSTDLGVSEVGNLVEKSAREVIDAGGRLLWIDGVISESQLAHMKWVSDCYVSIHRSEGWGLNLFESIQAGIPVIATAYGGSEQFMKLYDEVPSLRDLRIPYTITNVVHIIYLCIFCEVIFLNLSGCGEF